MYYNDTVVVLQQRIANRMDHITSVVAKVRSLRFGMVALGLFPREVDKSSTGRLGGRLLSKEVINVTNENILFCCTEFKSYDISFLFVYLSTSPMSFNLIAFSFFSRLLSWWLCPLQQVPAL